MSEERDRKTYKTCPTCRSVSRSMKCGFCVDPWHTTDTDEKCPECGGAIRGVPGLSTSGMIELCKNSWHGIKVDDMEAAFESVYASFEYGPHDHADAFKIWQTACKWKESTK